MFKVPAIQYRYLFVSVVLLCESSQVSGVTTEVQNGECSVDGQFTPGDAQSVKSYDQTHIPSGRRE